MEVAARGLTQKKIAALVPFLQGAAELGRRHARTRDASVALSNLRESANGARGKRWDMAEARQGERRDARSKSAEDFDPQILPNFFVASRADEFDFPSALKFRQSYLAPSPLGIFMTRDPPDPLPAGNPRAKGPLAPPEEPYS
jgi:hypothetical protein